MKYWETGLLDKVKMVLMGRVNYYIKSNISYIWLRYLYEILIWNSNKLSNIFLFEILYESMFIYICLCICTYIYKIYDVKVFFIVTFLIIL